MNDERVEHMVKFIEEQERELQATRLTSDSKMKSDIVNAILNELNKEVGE